MTVMDFEFISDRDNISHLPLHIQEEVKRRNLFTSSNSKSISFCGMIMEYDKVYIFIPRGSLYEKEMEYAALLMSTLEKYSLSGKHITTDDQDNLEYGLCYLTLAKELIADYQCYGLYTKVSKKKLLNSGKINWKETFQKQHPIIGQSGTPIYIKYNGYHYSSSNVHEISKIHAEIVHYLDCNLSWWLTKKYNVLIAPELSQIERSILSYDEKIYLLNKELGLAYSDREIRLFKNLISFLRQNPGTESTIFVLGIKKFEYPWEKMLNIVLKGKHLNSNQWLPVPVYKSRLSHLSDCKRPGMKPDIYIEDNKLLTGAVIDAKYYDANNDADKSFPALGDILKQICYADAVRLIHPNLKKIDNIFIFPGAEDYYSHVEFSHDDIDSEKISNVFPVIQCVYINPVDVIKAYVNNQYLDNIRNKLLSI